MPITWLSPIATGPATAIQAGILAPAESAPFTAPSASTAPTAVNAPIAPITPAQPEPNYPGATQAPQHGHGVTADITPAHAMPELPGVHQATQHGHGATAAITPAHAMPDLPGVHQAKHDGHGATVAITPANEASTAANPRPAWRSSAYRIVACRLGTRWSYAAWGPDRQPRGWAYRDYANGQARHWHPEGGRITYPIGHAIPQRRDLLGIHPTAALARAQCEAHHAATGDRP